MSRVLKKAECHTDRDHYCKSLCRQCYHAEYRLKNPEKCTTYYKTRSSTPEKRARDKLSWANRAYKVKYGMTLVDAENMLKEQGNECAICASYLTMADINVDHCHATGYVRGDTVHRM